MVKTVFIYLPKRNSDKGKYFVLTKKKPSNFNTFSHFENLIYTKPDVRTLGISLLNISLYMYF